MDEIGDVSLWLNGCSDIVLYCNKCGESLAKQVEGERLKGLIDVAKSHVCQGGD